MYNDFSHSLARSQRGGLFLGVIIGLLIGLGAALVVALYVTKVPVPFINKGLTKSTAEQDAQEAQKNKNWDPNAPLYGKNPAKPGASGVVGTLGATTATMAAGASITAPAPAPVSAPAAATGTVAKSAPATTTSTASTPKTTATAAKPSADPLGDLAKAKTAGSAADGAGAATGVDPFTYFVQAGAFRTTEDAESQKAKLSLAGFEARVTEREQSGRTVFRVRVGPLDKQGDAALAKEKLDGAGFETAIVRVQR